MDESRHRIFSFDYIRRVPFHPDRFLKWINNNSSCRLCSKGTIWLATRNHLAISFSLCGEKWSISPEGLWHAAIADEGQYSNDILKSIQDHDWDEQWGDRLTSLKVFCSPYDKEKVINTLDSALLNVDEITSNWMFFNDPLPKFDWLSILQKQVIF